MSLNHTRYNSHEEEIKKNQNDTKINITDKEEITNYDFKQDIYNDQDNNYNDKNHVFNSLLNKFREEIKFLKDYINRIHKEIRKNMKIEIPYLDDLHYKNNNKINIEKLSKLTDEKNINENLEEKIKFLKRNKNSEQNLCEIEISERDFNFNINFLKKYLDEASSSLINIDYINPILISYDKHIKNLLGVTRLP